MNTDLAIVARLTPPVTGLEAWPGMTTVESPIRNGIPHVVPLDQRLRLVLVLPTGLARRWLDLPVDAVVGSSATELAARPTLDQEPAFARGAPRLRVQRNQQTVAVLPLTPGLVVDAQEPDGRVRVRMQILDWLLHAGTVRGVGDFGSFLRFGVQAVDRGVDYFGALPLSDFTLRRLPVHQRLESRGGAKIERRLRRLVLLRERER